MPVWRSRSRLDDDRRAARCRSRSKSVALGRRVSPSVEECRSRSKKGERHVSPHRRTRATPAFPIACGLEDERLTPLRKVEPRASRVDSLSGVHRPSIRSIALYPAKTDATRSPAIGGTTEPCEEATTTRTRRLAGLRASTVQDGRPDRAVVIRPGRRVLVESIDPARPCHRRERLHPFDEAAAPRLNCSTTVRHARPRRTISTICRHRSLDEQIDLDGFPPPASSISITIMRRRWTGHYSGRKELSPVREPRPYRLVIAGPKQRIIGWFPHPARRCGS